MITENGQDIDGEALERLLRTGDVITVGFTLFPERLLIDTRSNETDGQFAGMVEPVGSVQERYLWLGKHRRTFASPEAFAFFIWPHTVRNLIERDALAALKSRLAARTIDSLDRGLLGALALEREAMAEAIRGSERWAAVWERPAA